ncbi:bestrophin-like domain [Dyella sp. Tek66A03]|uniref:bestrophin-like domain n=1 Tax=Dyella sp. Tek66A03 TaxID=3458298 RepID=UPI00403ED80B
MLFPASSAFEIFAALVVAALIGLGIRRVLPEEHKAQETVQLVQLVNGMLVTFAALMLSLLTASAKASFDNVTDDFHAFSSDLIQLDITLRSYGEEGDQARGLLRSYTAATIACTWPHERPPPGDYYPKDIDPKDISENLDDLRLDQLLNQAGSEVRRLNPSNPYHQALRNEGMEQFARAMNAHWKLIEEAHSSISVPFFLTLAFWLFVIFLSFGLIAPHNALALVTIGLGSLLLASVVYVIVDFDTLFRGMIIVPSQPMRDALTHMSLGMR